ncbi:hypothetical protein VB773_21725 [Haloarculaceae archaeon H-GB2-1]|nr:hypothetical protein [Haloarculaceae archaeon H-GB1-1]MEA5389256.1 hypothetical protein [Haloarculaceae archaeon H-GB11]MEA5409929.1 hypothetical protein [Haloarculaceae archaeon H-GB2-1]
MTLNLQGSSDGRRQSSLRGLVVAGLVFVYGYLAIRSWLNNWGATDSETTQPLPGDDLVPDPNYQATRAITIDAPPEEVWPWIVQLGAGRGGLYSYDWLDILFGILDRPSANKIRPEYQTLESGDTIPTGDEGEGLLVKAVEPERALVTVPESLPEETLTWVFVLEPLTEERTRLLTRNRGSIDWSLRWLVTLAIIEPAAFLMTRKMLLGIKQRAEAHAAL